jgi:hypothetical protein
MDTGDLSAPLIDSADQGFVEHNVPKSVADLFEADVLVMQRVAQEQLGRLEAERAGGAHPTHLHVARVRGRGYALRPRPRRGLPARCGNLVFDAFVGTLLVVALPEAVELALLASEVAGRRPRRLALELAVHPFVGAVLLWTRREDALVNDPELHPPDVQRAQSMNPRRSEGRAVVGADCLGQADLALTPALFTEVSPLQRRRARLKWSVTVSGKQ